MCVCAVSYTHLDVYKRQHLGCSALINIPVLAAKILGANQLLTKVNPYSHHKTFPQLVNAVARTPTWLVH